MTSWWDYVGRKADKEAAAKRVDPEKTDVNITVKPWRYEVTESRLSDTGVIRIREAITRHKRGERS